MIATVLSLVLASAVAGIPAAVGAGSPVLEKVSQLPPLTPLQLSTHGRVLKSPTAVRDGPGSVDYVSQWPGIYFEAAFRGTEVFFRVGASREMLHVVVDSMPAILLSDPAAGSYRLSGLENSEHTVSIFVATESQAAPNHFGGFSIPKGEVGRTPILKARQIEFIGDSHTVGYGNTSAKRECSSEEIYATTDNTQAFGALTARHFHADYEVNAISGRGIVRNYNGFAADTLPQAYPYLLFDKKEAAADAAWKPRLVVVALGTNDFSTALNPGERWTTRDGLHSDFEATYVRFLQGVLAQSPDAYLVLWATAGGEVAAEEQRVVDRMKALGNRRVGFVAVQSLSFGGCDYHPSVADDVRISESLTQFVDTHPEVWGDR